MTTVQLRKASDMALSRPVVWRLAPGYLAAGKVNLLVGAEGIGKSLGRSSGGVDHHRYPVGTIHHRQVLPTRS